MCGEDNLVAILNAHYGGIPLLAYSESADEIRFQVPAAFGDSQTASFRSRAQLLDELAVTHRLSLLVGRHKCGVPGDSILAIASVSSSVASIDPVDACEVRFRCEVTDRRRHAPAAFRSTLLRRTGVEAHITSASFNILPASLASFVRRARRFEDYSEVQIDRQQSTLIAVADDHLRYYASEADRISDGARVDHVPALTLIDIALSLATKPTAFGAMTAEFLAYTDPRVVLDIFRRQERHAFEFVQNDQVVVVVRDRGVRCPSPQALICEPFANQQSGRGFP